MDLKFFKLVESLTYSYPYHWLSTHTTGQDVALAKFKNNQNNIIAVTFEKTNDSPIGYAVVFTRSEHPLGKQSIDITNTGDQFKIFATVIKIIKDFVYHHNEVYEIEFSADKFDKNENRTRLYKGLIRKFMPS